MIAPARDLLPSPVKGIVRERLKWDAVFNTARSQLFVIEENHVVLQPEARQRSEQFITAQLPSGASTYASEGKAQD